MAEALLKKGSSYHSSQTLFFDIATHDFTGFRLHCCLRIRSRIDGLFHNTSGHSDTRSGAGSWHSPHRSARHAFSGFDWPRKHLLKRRTMQITDQLSFSGEQRNVWCWFAFGVLSPHQRHRYVPAGRFSEKNCR